MRELATTFNVMLERLDASFDGQRRFIANASHELRTPLALNRTLLEVSAEEETTAHSRQLISALLAINDRHTRLIEGLLLLARSEGEPPEKTYVDLADVVEHVAEITPAGAVRVHTEPGEAATMGSPVLLERLVQNLVENAVRYNVPDDGWVFVGSRTGPDGTAVVEVTNPGPVVPAYEIPSLFEPFHRGAGDRTAGAAGTGLGLSIVRAIARAHDGDVRATPRPGGGLVVTVNLPGQA